MKEYEMKSYYVVKECQCGGDIDIEVNSRMYMTYPPQKDYKCNKCGKIYMLSEKEFPRMKYKKD